MALVRTDGLTKRYRQGEVEVYALREVSLDFEVGEFSALVGPSGSGKTTLLNLIGGLDEPTSGKIMLDGQDLVGMSERDRSQYRLHKVGFIFQAYNLVPVLSALENVEFIMVLQGRPPSACRRRAMDYLARVGLADLAHRRPKALSGGQQQRVAVARALAAGPRLVLADEPTANLDSESASDLLALMARMNQEDGVTFIFSTHDQRVMAKARRIITLKDGQVHDIRTATEPLHLD